MIINDLVSIVMPAYNASKTILESIDSVRNQSYKNWELLIIDDCSIDGTYQLVRDLMRDDDRIKLFKNDVNIGISDSRNRGLELANGNFIAFLDSDDLWLPNKIKFQLNFMKTNNYGFTFTSYRRFISSNYHKSKLITPINKFTYKSLLTNTGIPCLTVMLNRHIVGNISFQKVGHEDFVLWLQILKKGINAYGLNEVLALYRVSQYSVSSNKIRTSLWVWHIYRNIEKLSLLKSLFYFSLYAFNAMTKRFF
jgi:glycosyltransferase involved in cell wall biosynthesis